MSHCVDCNTELPGPGGLVRCDACWGLNYSSYRVLREQRSDKRRRKKEVVVDAPDLFPKVIP